MALVRPNLRFSTTLSNAADDEQTTLQLNALPPVVPCILTLEPKTENEEIVKVTASGVGQVTVVRGYGGTSAVAHNIGSAIADYNAPTYIDELADAFEVEHNDDGTHDIPDMVIQADIADMVTEDGEQTLTNKTLTTPVIEDTWVAKGEHDNGNSGTSKEIDWANGDRQKVTLTGNCTFTYANAEAGQTLTLRLVQDGTGGRTVTLPTSFWPNGEAGTFSDGANEIDLLIVYSDGTNYLTQLATNFS